MKYNYKMQLFLLFYSWARMATAGGGGDFKLGPVQSTSIAGKIASDIICFRIKSTTFKS
jgi:hypothetical protein